MDAFKRHARKDESPCKARLVSDYGLNEAGSSRWFNLYYLGLRNDVVMSNKIFRILAERERNEPLY